MSQQEDVIRMLEQAGPEGVTSNQFYNAFLPRFSARIHELRNKGFNIVKEPVEQGHFRYILVGRETPSGDADRSGLAAQSGANFTGDSPTPATGGTPRRGSSPATPPAEAVAPSSDRPAPGQLFEVIEDGPSPVNPYEWEAA